MIGKPHHTTRNPTVHTSPWDSYNDPTAEIFSPTTALLTALSRYLPSNEPLTDLTDPIDGNGKGNGISTDSDDFRMYEFKVRMCTRPKAHDWTECPYAHPGEKARRRDPRRYSYSGTACSDFRKGGCRRGDACDFAHGVFECWLHPTRYRTQACKDGPGCTRRVCFFAHAPGQLRVGSGQPSPVSIGSTSPDPFDDSPPVTPVARAYGPGDVAAALRNLQLSNIVKPTPAGSVWKGLGSPRFGPSTGFYSLPTTPNRMDHRAGLEDSPAECSGRELRLRMWEKLSDENRVNLTEPAESTMGGPGPDIGWVSELVK